MKDRWVWHLMEVLPTNHFVQKVSGRPKPKVEVNSSTGVSFNLITSFIELPTKKFFHN